MPRKPNIRPSSSLDVHMDEELRTRLDLFLFSETEGRVPKGAYQRFFNSLLTQFFDHKGLDLSPYLGCLPGENIIRAHPATIAALRAHLERTES